MIVLNKKPNLDDDFIKNINKSAKESGNTSKAKAASSAKNSRLGRIIFLVVILFLALNLGFDLYLATCRPLPTYNQSPELTAAWQTTSPTRPGYDATGKKTKAGLWLSVPGSDFPSLYTIARFDGQPVLCILDTGSDFSYVPDSAYFWRRKRSGTMTQFGIFGDKKVVDRVDLKIHYAGLDLDDEAVARRPAEMGAGGKAVLGRGILRDRQVLFDFSKGRLVFGVEPAVKERLPLEVDDLGNLILPARFGTCDTKVVWDTGFTCTSVSGEFYEKHKGCFEATGTSLLVTDILGNVSHQKVFLCRDLIVGGHHFFDHRVLVMDKGFFSGLKGDHHEAILGLDIILNADWYFDLHKKEWILWAVDQDRLKRWQRKKNTFALIPRVKESLVDPSGFVDKEEREKLRALLEKFSRETDADVRVILLPAGGNWDMEAYSAALGQKWDGTSQQWLYFVYSIASGKIGVCFHGSNAKFAQNYNRENIHNILQKVTAEVDSKQYGVNRMFREFMERMYELNQNN